MKRFIAVMVALGICGLYWLGCEKKVGVEGTEEPVVEKIVPPPPPPPPPPVEEPAAPQPGGEQQGQ